MGYGKSVWKRTELCFPGFPDHLLWRSFLLDGRLSDSQPCQLRTTGILHTHCLSTLQAIDCRYAHWRIFSCLHSQQGTVDLTKRYMIDCQVSLKVCKTAKMYEFFDEEQGKQVCKTTAFRCHQFFSQRLLLLLAPRAKCLEKRATVVFCQLLFPAESSTNILPKNFES